MKIEGSVVLVTGASSGIGLATARHLAARGARVALVARSADILAELAKELPGSLAIAADVCDFDALRAAIAQTVSHYGRIDGLVNNAGRSYDSTIENIDPVVFEEIYRLNVLAPVVAMQAVIAPMRAQGGGSIVNVNSGTAVMKLAGYGVYASSKRALVGLSFSARLELAPDGIVVSSVYPAVTATNFGVNKVIAEETNDEALAQKRDYSHGDPPRTRR